MWHIIESTNWNFTVSLCSDKTHCLTLLGHSIVLEDSAACIALANDGDEHRPRTRHLGIKLHHFRDQINFEWLKVQKVPLADNLSDIFTKPLTESPISKTMWLNDWMDTTFNQPLWIQQPCTMLSWTCWYCLCPTNQWWLILQHTVNDYTTPNLDIVKALHVSLEMIQVNTHLIPLSLQWHILQLIWQHCIMVDLWSLIKFKFTLSWFYSSLREFGLMYVHQLFSCFTAAFSHYFIWLIQLHIALFWWDMPLTHKDMPQASVLISSKCHPVSLWWLFVHLHIPTLIADRSHRRYYIYKPIFSSSLVEISLSHQLAI